MLMDDGWVKVSQKGSHEQWKHPVKSGRVMVAGKDSIDVPPVTLKSIYFQAGLEK
jgi:predicted RNA binding protein YcfA (HicA-like mRNA interferase family)